MKNFKKIGIIFVILFLICLIVHLFLKKPNLMPIEGQMKNIDLSNVNKLMIISHPGDESVWGGVHLLSDNYLVVCLSCGYDKGKTDIFKKVIQNSDDSFIMMGYSDKIYLKRDYKRIRKQLGYILNYKKWDEVVSHNPDGEYKNYQHKQINKLLNEFNINNFYYFGKYYDKEELNRLDKETFLEEALIKRKVDYMVKQYNGLYNDYKHMLPFEDWIGANTWEN